MGALIQSHDWSATSLGRLEDWPPALRISLGIALGAGAPVAICWGAEHVLVYNDHWRGLIGDKHPAALGRPAREVFPEIWGEIGPIIADVMAGGGAARVEDRLLPLDRSGRIEDAWFSFGFDPIPLEDGSIGGVFNSAAETTARIREERAHAAAEQALRESEARFREFGDASSDALWIRNALTLEWDYLSAAFDAIYGIDRARAVASRSVGTLLDVILPDDRARTLAAIRTLRDAEGVYEYRIRRPSDGEIRWLRTTGFPLVDADGVVRRLGGIIRDVTEERNTADRMDVLVAELQHRTRNLIGVIRAIARRTQRTSASLDAFGDDFAARLDALARANGLLSKLKEGDRVTFDELLWAELRGHGVAADAEGGRLVVEGPRGIRLRSTSVQTLALALHELLTNATKHGALGRPQGRLCVLWDMIEIGGEFRLRVEWRETWDAGGAPEPAPAPADGGYGRELIERAIPFQLGAQTFYDLRRDGLTCVLVMPLSKRPPGDP